MRVLLKIFLTAVAIIALCAVVYGSAYRDGYDAGSDEARETYDKLLAEQQEECNETFDDLLERYQELLEEYEIEKGIENHYEYE